jgi:hypothetical protein
MKSVAMMVAFALLAFSPASATQGSPIEKIIEMLSSLQTKIIAEGTEAQKAYDEHAEWCEDRSKNLGFEIKTGKDNKAELEATIQDETSTIAALETKIEQLSNDIQTDESDLAAATKIRESEASDFAAEEKELTTVLSMLERATAILTKEMGGASASMLQVKGATNIADALRAMVQASVLSSADASSLTAMVQTEQESGDSDANMGAPAAAVYEGQSGGIIGVLEGLTEKADGQLEKARKAESTSLQNYQMLKQSLTDEVEFANKDMDKAKKNLAAAQEGKATAEGGLAVTTKDLAEDIATKGTLHQECMSAAEEFELATKSRGEELNALATAKKVIKESTSGAAEQSYSFLQVERSQVNSRADLAKLEAVRFVRDLARKTKSPALAQLASRMSSAMRLGVAAGEDPFAKVKSLITDMLATLEADGEADASHKAYCDKEMAATTAKKDELTTESDKLSTSIDQKKAASAKLKEESATLQTELAGMAKARAEAESLRSQEKADFDKNSAEMSQGIDGVKKALKVLKDYYAQDAAHGAAEGAGSGIISLLEVCESDFTKGLTEMTAEEDSAAADFKAYVKEDDINKAMKSQDLKYKSKEAAGLDKAVSELSGDLAATTDELAAVTSAMDKLKDMCVAKAEPYAERKARRESELAGLKEALEILEGEAALIQKTTQHTLRGVRAH